MIAGGTSEPERTEVEADCQIQILLGSDDESACSSVPNQHRRMGCQIQFLSGSDDECSSEPERFKVGSIN